MTTRGEALALLRRALENPTAEFRDGQWEAVDALVNHRRKALVIQRTGWGKSSVYFISTRILRNRGSGPTLIVSPLLALMRNQLEAASRLGIEACSINSSNAEEWEAHKRAVLNNRADVLLVSPERLANDDFVNNVLLPIANRIGLLVVDEAHCISDWGHDFRPDYRRLVNVLQRIPPNVPVLGTTATANNRVIQDIRTQLGDIEVRRGSLMRESLSLQTLKLPDQASRLAWLAEQVPQLSGTGIIYVLTKRDADQVAKWLQQRGIDAHAYHAGATQEGIETDAYRQELESRLLRNEVKALVATSALGMGYDKPDLGFVIHYQAPASVVHYYQQVGRAGRAIDHAVGVLIAGREDGDIQEYFRVTAFPDEEHVAAVLGALEASDGLTKRELEFYVNMRAGQIEKVLKLLSVENPAPVIKEGSTWRRTAVNWRLDRDKINRLTRQREQEWAEIQEYVHTRGCLMQYLASKLDDPQPSACGKCSSCRGEPVVPSGYSRAIAAEAARFLRRSEFVLEGKKQATAGGFPKYGLPQTLPKNWRTQSGRVLSRWGDAGWGEIVREDKRTGRFRDELVDGVAEMIENRWRPEPIPQWLTCIPSQRRPELLPDFAARLADRLGIPYVPALAKVRLNEPQKLQQNRHRQCMNLDGVFAVQHPLPAGPVLLVDDVVDSRWTLTIAAALLLREGSGPVYPLALAQSSAGD